MSQSIALERNPFMLLVDPAAVIAAVERSERLGRLNRHLCRPLDKPAPGTVTVEDTAGEDNGADEPLALS